METLTICCSIKHKQLIRSTISKLKEIGITALFPNLDSGIPKDQVTLNVMKTIESEHFQAIDSSQAIYVICPEGIVGTLVSVEVGYAKSQDKPVIFSEPPQDLGLQAVATDYIPLNQLEKLKDFPPH